MISNAWTTCFGSRLRYCTLTLLHVFMAAVLTAHAGAAQNSREFSAYYADGSAELGRESLENIRTYVKGFRNDHSAVFIVNIGCGTGDAASLSDRRFGTLKSYFLNLGFPESRIRREWSCSLRKGDDRGREKSNRLEIRVE